MKSVARNFVFCGCIAVVLAACDGRNAAVGTGEARYPSVATAWPAIADRLEPPLVETNLASWVESLEQGTTEKPVLTGVQTGFWPALLWHSPRDRVTLFADLGRAGLGGPSFLAYSSPTGIATLRVGGSVLGEQMRERWLLAGFAGADGWTEWDSPWAVFLHERPRRVRFETNGVTLTFVSGAGFWTMMPLYGAYRPPQQGKEVLGPAGLPEKGLLTWEWPIVVARDPLTRLRFWSGAAGRFPIGWQGTVGLNDDSGTVDWKEHFSWAEFPDVWNTRRVRVTPVSPTLGLALSSSKGRPLPVGFAESPRDFEWPTVYGPWFGIAEEDVATIAFRVLRYVNETEVHEAGPSGDSSETAAVLASLRELGSDVFPSPEAYRPDGLSGWNTKEAFRGYLWQARATRFLDPGVRSNALACLRLALWERVVVPSRFVEKRERLSEGSERFVPEDAETRDPEWVSALLQAVWAVADAAGDRDRVRERWPLLRRAYDLSGGATWVGLGRGAEAIADGAAGALAFARLAWLAGDDESYRHGCADAGRELVQIHARLRGGRWFREQQPWFAGPLLPERASPMRLVDRYGGWSLSGPARAGERDDGWPRSRWSNFHDPDVARYLRDTLSAEVRSEVATLPADSTEAAMLRHFGISTTNTPALARPRASGGLSAERIAALLGRLRTTGQVRIERLISPGASGGRAPEWRENDHLVGSIGFAFGEVNTWPRIYFHHWPTPAGSNWEVGAVRVEGIEGPIEVRRLTARHGTAWQVVAAGGTK